MKTSSVCTIISVSCWHGT